MNDDEPIFTMKQFLALAKLLDQKGIEHGKDIQAIDTVNSNLQDMYEELEEKLRLVSDRNKMLNDALLHKDNAISNLTGHVRDLKQDLARSQHLRDLFADKEKLLPIAMWARLEEILLDFGGPNKITAIKEYRSIFDCGLREAKDAIEGHFYTEGDTYTLKPEYVQALEKAKEKRAAEHRQKICNPID